MEPSLTLPRAVVRSLLLLLALLLGACSPIQRPPDLPASSSDLALDAPLPNDPNLRIGVLGNGFTYYIRHNDQPARRAELMLAVNAGSLMEDDDQLGLAHFVEHMLFNGTERFPANELIDFLADIGVEFGPDLNAYTSFDETVYMLPIPTDDPEIVDRALDVLEDWAAYATFDPAEVESERGVVVEEWRLYAADARGRVWKQLLPVLLGDSHYAARNPIGDVEIVRTAPVETLRRFYTDWYRPDLMAVIAVGDLDVDTVEEQIKERFGKLPASAQPRPRLSFQAPEHAEPRYLVIADPEQPFTSIQVWVKRPAMSFTTVADFRRDLIGALFYQMFNARLAELTRQTVPPFVRADAYEYAETRSLTVAHYAAQVQEDGLERGFTALLTEIERVYRHGFTASELERAKATVLRRYEQANKEEGDTDSADFAFVYLDHFLNGIAATSAASDYQMAQALLPEITLAEVNHLADDLVASANRVTLVTAPRKEGSSIPTADDLAAIYTTVAASDIEPYQDQMVTRPLFAERLEPVEILSETEHSELGIIDLTLANGVRVLVKPTDFQQDEVVFAASSSGGLSLVADEDYWAGRLADSVVNQSGVGEFTRNDLVRLLAGKDVSVAPYIGDLEEGLHGSASADDLETLFQLIYLVATAPRADAEGFAATQNMWTAYLENRLLDPRNVLYDTADRLLYGDNPRYRLPTREEVRTVNLQRAAAIYQERFADMDDFTFVFAGNLDLPMFKGLAQRYLGALPGLPGDESWRDRSLDPPAGVLEQKVFKGQEEQSIVNLTFTGAAEPSEENRTRIAVLRRLLNNLIVRELRETRGGVYSAGVWGYIEVEPKGRYTLGIEFSCAPDRVDELVSALFELITTLQEEGPTAADVARANQQAQSDQEEVLEQNGWWVDQILYYVTTSERSLDDLLAQNRTADIADAITLQAAARDFLPQDRYVKVVLYPETHAE